MIEMARRDLLGLSLAALTLAGCQRDAGNVAQDVASDGQNLPDAEELTPEAQAFGAAVADFGDRLLAKLRAASPKETVLFSPLCTATSLAVLYRGARGETAREIGQVLGFDRKGLTPGRLAGAYGSFRRRIAETPNGLATVPAQVALANGIWVARSAALNEGFARSAAADFGASVTSADFADSRLSTEINRFVAEATRNRITDAIEELDATTTLAVVNALYFKAGWEDPFEVALTQDDAFTTATGAKLVVPTMRRKGWFGYAETSRVQAVILPYADLRFELVLVLGKAAGGDRAGLVTEGLSAMENGEFLEGEVVVPRLDLSWKHDLVAALRSAGLGQLLGAGPDLGAAVGQPVVVEAMMHKARFLMDEEGAEAAAVQSASAPAADAEPTKPPPPFVFRADRPFSLVLRETSSGAPLMMGYVASPSSEGP